MIKKQSDIETKVSRDLRGGTGEVAVHHFLTEEESGGAGRLFAKIVIEPGGSIGYHQHVENMESYYIIKGKGLVNDNNEAEVVLEPGDCHICLDGNYHSITSVSDEPLEFIALVINTK